MRKKVFTYLIRKVALPKVSIHTAEMTTIKVALKKIHKKEYKI